MLALSYLEAAASGTRQVSVDIYTLSRCLLYPTYSHQCHLPSLVSKLSFALSQTPYPLHPIQKYYFPPMYTFRPPRHSRRRTLRTPRGPTIERQLRSPQTCVHSLSEAGERTVQPQGVRNLRRPREAIFTPMLTRLASPSFQTLTSRCLRLPNSYPTSRLSLMNQTGQSSQHLISL